MTTIKSRQNPEVKKLRALQETRGRKKYQEFLLEGPQVLEEVSPDNPAKKIYYRQGYTGYLPRGVKTQALEASLFNSLSPTSHSQGILALYDFFPSKDTNLQPGLNLYLDGLRDPGNLGGLIRSAVSFGVRKIFMSPDCVDLYNPKVVRSTMSALFKLDYAYLDRTGLQGLEGINLIRADLGGQDLTSLSWPKQVLLILGNEAHGVHEDLKGISQPISIPMEESMDSLNVNVAGSICMYDYYQKCKRSKP